MLTFRAKGYIINVHSKEIYKVKRGRRMINNLIIFGYGILIGFVICLMFTLINDIRNEEKDE